MTRETAKNVILAVKIVTVVVITHALIVSKDLI